MSTTLATNALVEGQGGRATLVMVGFDEPDLACELRYFEIGPGGALDADLGQLADLVAGSVPGAACPPGGQHGSYGGRGEQHSGVLGQAQPESDPCIQH